MAEASSTYDLVSSVDNFPYLQDKKTIETIRDHGRLMFLVRGSNSTGKALLSEMIKQNYPMIEVYSGEDYFTHPVETPVRSPYTLKAAHEYCQNRARSACIEDLPLILVQNDFPRKIEMQFYLDLAVKFNYTVIMGIAHNRFKISTEASTDSLEVEDFHRRLGDWEDVPPFVTGWFLCPRDAAYLQSAAMQVLKKLSTGKGKSHEVPDCFDGDLLNLFRVRNIFCCLAGYSCDPDGMKKYYLGDSVQDVYGKSFEITILGFHVTPFSMNAVVAVDEQMKPLLFGYSKPPQEEGFLDEFRSLNLSDNALMFYARGPFPDEAVSQLPPKTSCSDWEPEEKFEASESTFIHVAKRPSGSLLDIGRLRDQFQSCMEEAGDRLVQSDFTELDNGLKVRQVREEEWLIMAEKKIALRTVFTGYYP